MLTAVMYVNNTENQENCSTVSQAVTWLSSEMDADRGHVGEIRDSDKMIAGLRREHGVTKIMVYESSFFASGLNLSLSTPVEFQGTTIQQGNAIQSFGTNMQVGGSVKFGNVRQVGGGSQALFTGIDSSGDIDLGDLSQG
jgi:hypothetical protein